MIKNLIVEQSENKGRYVFRFWKDTEWVKVEIDDRLPCDSKGKLVFASCRDKREFWLPLFEKAYAKHFGTYQQLIGGHIRDALVDLTGGVSQTIEIDPKMNQNQLWNTLLEFYNSGEYFMGVSMFGKGSDNTEDNFIGLIQKHAYGIVKLVEYNGNKLINLRNPWGKFEFKGEWSDSDTKWTEEMRKTLNFVQEDDGLFWMSLKDFIYNFTNLDIVWDYKNSKKKWNSQEIKGEWDVETDGGDFTNSRYYKTNISNPQYCLNLENDSNVIISLTQHDYRFFGDYKNKLNSIGFCTVKDIGKVRIESLNNDIKLEKASHICTSSREISIQTNLKKGKYFLIVYTNNPGTLDQYLFKLFSSASFTLEKVASYYSLKGNVRECIGEWSNELTKDLRAFNSKQYLLEVSDISDVVITIDQESESVIKKENPLDDIYLYIFKSEDGKKSFFDEAFPKKYGHKLLKETFTLQPHIKYVLLPLLDKPEESKFKIKVTWESSNIKVKLNEISEFHPNVLIKNKWVESIKSEDTFYDKLTVKQLEKGIKFKLEVFKDDTNICFDLVTESNYDYSHDTGILLLNTKFDKTGFTNGFKAIGNQNYQSTILSCSRKDQLKKGIYLVVITSKLIGKSYQLMCSSKDLDFSFSELKNEEWNNLIEEKGDETKSLDKKEMKIKVSKTEDLFELLSKKFDDLEKNLTKRLDQLEKRIEKIEKM